MEPTTIALLITSITTLLLNIYQSVKSRHFESTCCGCMECAYVSEHHDNNNKNSPRKLSV